MTHEEDIDRILRQHRREGRSGLIPILQEVQEAQGYLSEEVVARIGRFLELPASKMYGIATFYNQFRFQPKGRFHITVCRGTACHVKGSARVLDAVQQHLGLRPGETSRDGLFSLEEVACLGACGLSPVICINGEFHAQVTPKTVIALLESHARKEEKDAEAHAR